VHIDRRLVNLGDIDLGAPAVPIRAFLSTRALRLMVGSILRLFVKFRNHLSKAEKRRLDRVVALARVRRLE